MKVCFRTWLCSWKLILQCTYLYLKDSLKKSYFPLYLTIRGLVSQNYLMTKFETKIKITPFLFHKSIISDGHNWIRTNRLFVQSKTLICIYGLIYIFLFMPMFIRPTFTIFKQLSLTVTPLPMVKNVHVVQKTIIISEHINNT